MGIAVQVAWREDEAAAQLKRILPQLVLPESTALRAFPRLRVVGPKQVKKVSGLETGRVIGLPLFVDQQWKFDARLFAESSGVARVPQADSGQFRAFRLELGFVVAQLRDMLAAEDSAVVAKKNDHSRLQLPQRSEPYGDAIGIRQRDTCQCLAKRGNHKGNLSQPLSLDRQGGNIAAAST
jgi:hypothetical protein